jgi:hypothetical protein
MPISNNLHAPLCPQDPPATRDFSPLCHIDLGGYITSLTHFFQRSPQELGVFTLKLSGIGSRRQWIVPTAAAAMSHPVDHHQVAIGSDEPVVVTEVAPEIVVSPAAAKSRSFLGLLKYMVDWYPKSYSALERRTVFKLDCFLLPVCGIMCKRTWNHSIDTH